MNVKESVYIDDCRSAGEWEMDEYALHSDYIILTYSDWLAFMGYKWTEHFYD